MKKINIAFTLISSKSWMGGFNYLLNLLTALAQFESTKIQPFIFCGEDALESDVAAFEKISAVKVIRSSIFNSKNRKIAQLQALLMGVDLNAKRCFTQHRIDVVFENATFYGWRFPLPAIAWFSDLQHKIMPEFFSNLSWIRRELGFRLQIASGRRILLSSKSVQNDFESLYKKTASHSDVLTFPARIRSSDLNENPWELISSYNIPKVFAFLPNQFWKHKNHAVVIESLAILRKKGIHCTVVATGNTQDPRHPQLYKELEERIKALDLGNYFRVLGMVPRDHLLALMQTCSVLINPSLFEGWSTTVEEGKTLGVPMILSDLTVHREQAKNIADFFPGQDPERLAAFLEKYVNSAPDKYRTVQTNEQVDFADFARKFTKIALQCINYKNHLTVQKK